jgi:hypothetical protein
MLRMTWIPMLVVALWATGCGDDAETTPRSDAGPQDAGGDAEENGATAQVRAIHLSPDAPDVDIFVDGDGPVVSDLAFPEGTGYLTVPAGSYDFDVAPAGAGVGSSVLSVSGLALAEGEAYTVVAYDEVASITALALTDDLSAVGGSNIRLRAIHVASAVGEVDIWNVTDPGDPQPIYTNVEFGDVAPYVELPVAAYSVGFDVDGDSVPDVVFDVPELPAGTIVNVFAVSSDADVFLIAQLADGTTVRIDPSS